MNERVNADFYNFFVIFFYDEKKLLFTSIPMNTVAQIEKVFNAASHKKVWDHFTKAQRKSIDQWNKLAMVRMNTFHISRGRHDLFLL